MEPRRPPTLPVEMLLEIIARSDDVKTIVRCGVVSKPLRRAMLDPGFRRRLADRAEANGGFDPDLLMAVSYGLIDIHTGLRGTPRTDPIVVVHPPGRLHFDTRLLGSFEPGSSRDGLLVLLRRNRGVAPGLLVCNAITGHVTTLPSMGLRDTSTSGMYQPAMLSVDGAGRSFELLVMYKNNFHGLVTQIFSSEDHEWGAAHEIHIQYQPPGTYGIEEAGSTSPVVIGRSVHWLCYTKSMSSADSELVILAVHAESAQTTLIRLPQLLLTRMESPSYEPSALWTSYAGSIILATTSTAEGEKRLSLLVAERFSISTWTLVPEPGEEEGFIWSRQEVIRRRDIIDRSHASVLDAYQLIRFSMFGKRSGTVLFWMQNVGLFQLNIGTKKARMLWRSGSRCSKSPHMHACLHEMNLISVLAFMKSF